MDDGDDDDDEEDEEEEEEEDDLEQMGTLTYRMYGTSTLRRTFLRMMGGLKGSPSSTMVGSSST